MAGEIELIPNANTGLRYFIVNTFYRTPHFHREIEICFLLEGALSVHRGNQTLNVGKNEFYIINSWDPHGSQVYSRNEKTIVLGLHISSKILQDVVPEISNMKFAFRSYNYRIQPEYKYVIKLLLDGAQDYFERNRSRISLRAKAMTYLLFDAILKNCHYELYTTTEAAAQLRQTKKIERIISYIDENCWRKVTLTEIGQNLGLSMGYLSHLFYNSLGISFHEYLKRIRCEKAAELLQSTPLSILEVSEQCGFSDVKYLRVAFMERYGCLPHDYRKYHISAGFVSSVRINYKISDTEESFPLSSECLEILNAAFNEITASDK